MKKFLFLMLLLLVGCTNYPGLIKISPRAIGDMPSQAKSTYDFEIWIANVTDVTNHDPRTTVKDNDTLKVSWGYEGPDNLPTGVLPYSQEHSLIVLNTDDIWRSDSTSLVEWKDWIYLNPGPWQMRVDARNRQGDKAISGRYDFIVKGTAPVKVIIRGIL